MVLFDAYQSLIDSSTNPCLRGALANEKQLAARLKIVRSFLPLIDIALFSRHGQQFLITS